MHEGAGQVRELRGGGVLARLALGMGPLWFVCAGSLSYIGSILNRSCQF